MDWTMSVNKVTIVILACLMSVLLSQCNVPSATPLPEKPIEDVATACSRDPFDARPARRMILACVKKLGNGCAEKALVLDNTVADKLVADGESAAAEADRLAGEVDRYFRQLAAAGVGTWDGCYGDNTPVPLMTSTVHHPSYTGFQPGSAIGETLFQDDRITFLAVTHEWSHGILLRQTGIDLTGENHAISESLSDTLGFAISGERNYLIDGTTGKRNFAQPSKLGHPDTYGKYEETLGPYANAGILNRAAYLLLRDPSEPDGPVPPDSVLPIGRRKVAILFFHVLQPKYIGADVTFATYAASVVAACQELAERNQSTCGASPGPDTICAAECEQVRNAYESVGLPPKASLTGVWQGPIDQAGAAPYSVRIALNECGSNALCGEFAYPEPKCGGTLTLLSSDQGSYVLREKLTYGQDRCANDGTVTLVQQAGNIWAYHWSHPGYGVADGVIERTEP